MQAQPFSHKTPDPLPAEGCTLEGLGVLGTVSLCPSPGLSVTPSAELDLLQWASLGEAWRCLEEPRTFEGEELGAFAAFMAICSGEGI